MQHAIFIQLILEKLYDVEKIRMSSTSEEPQSPPKVPTHKIDKLIVMPSLLLKDRTISQCLKPTPR